MIPKFLRDSKFLSTIISSVFLILILAATGFDVLPLLKKCGEFGIKATKYIESNDLKHMFNSSVLIGVSNLVLYILVSFPKIDISLRNSKLKSDSTELPLVTSTYHTQRSFYLYINVNYSNIFGYVITKLLGGIKIELIYPSWVDLTVDSRFWNTAQFTDNSIIGAFVLNISDAVSQSKLKNYSGEVITKIDLITNQTIDAYDEDFIDIVLKPKSNNKLLKFLSNCFIKLFYDVSYEPHKIKAN